MKARRRSVTRKLTDSKFKVPGPFTKTTKHIGPFLPSTGLKKKAPKRLRG